MTVYVRSPVDSLKLLLACGCIKVDAVESSNFEMFADHLKSWEKASKIRYFYLFGCLQINCASCVVPHLSHLEVWVTLRDLGLYRLLKHTNHEIVYDESSVVAMRVAP